MLSYIKVNERKRAEIFLNNSAFPFPIFSAAPCNFRISIETFINAVLSFNRNICDSITIEKVIGLDTNDLGVNTITTTQTTQIF